MTNINTLESVLGVDMEMMLGDIISAVLAPCDAQVNQGGVIAYFENDILIVTEYEENGEDRYVWSEVGKLKVVAHLNARIANITKRIAVETLCENPTPRGQTK